MTVTTPRRHSTFTNPLQGMAVGDPFVLRHRGRFYLYGTNDGPPLPDGRQIPAFRSDDLILWEPLGGVLEPSDPTADHWAPEVLFWNGRFFMVVSFGDVDRRGHALWVATADRPEGPFRLEAQVSDPSERFSIDGSWLLDDDGGLYLFRCLDFVEESAPPFGTGIVVQRMRDPLTPVGPPATVLRAHAPWQLFLPNRTMPLYSGRTFAEWTTIEGPAPVRRAGRVFCGYSGGNYLGAYGTGEAVADSPLGPYTDLRGQDGPIFGTTPGLVEGPGHFSVVRPDGLHDWIVLHGRTPGEGVRRPWLCPARWDANDVTIGPLTDQPQPTPPLPTVLARFAGADPTRLDGWTLDGRKWALVDEGIRLERASAWFQEVRLSGDWVVEAYLRFPEPDGGPAGLVVRPDESTEFSILVDPDRLIVRAERPGIDPITKDLPRLGDPLYDPKVFHVMGIRSLRGMTKVRIDGVLVFENLPFATPARLGLRAEGIAVFDAVGITLEAGAEPD